MRPAQLVYAGIDAYVCLAAFNVLEDLAEHHNRQVNFAKWVDTLIKHKNKLPKGFKFQPRKEDQPDGGRKVMKAKPLPAIFRPSKPLTEESISPPDLKVVCDTMLQGLCKKLRLRGVDAIALESYEYFENCARVAIAEKRMIITRGSHAQKLQTMVPRGHCYSIQHDQLDQQIEEVFWYFNVDQDDKYLFSRCQKCNGNKYAILTSYQAQTIHENQGGSKDSPKKAYKGRGSPGRKGRSHYDPYDDPYGGFLDDEDSDPGEVLVSMASVSVSQYFQCDKYEVEKGSGMVKGTEVILRFYPDVPRAKFAEQTKFYGCIKCGKIFWEGSHWSKMFGKQSNN